MYKPHLHCRACGYASTLTPPGIKASSSDKLTPVFNLGVQPLANDFCDETEPRSGFAPLSVNLCPNCLLGQLSVVVDPEILYRHYCYVTSKSETMMRHFARLWSHLQGLGVTGKVVEIGSNDGLFLSYVKKCGAVDVLGIDPALNLAKQAEARGVKTIPTLFSQDVAKSARSFFGTADVIVARHVFCHADNWKEFVASFDHLAGDHTTILIETPYCPDMLKRVEFDTIYHEHLSYLTIKSVRELLKNTRFALVDVIRFDIHGGSVGLVIKSGSHPVSERVDEMVRAEESCIRALWATFEDRVNHKIESLREAVNGIVSTGKSVCGFGASAKSTVWINACGFNRNKISFICDNTPEKQNLYSPGSNIPITDEGALLRELPSHAVMFSWNFCDEILRKQQRYTQLGGRFIIPTPEFRIV